MHSKSQSNKETPYITEEKWEEERDTHGHKYYQRIIEINKKEKEINGESNRENGRVREKGRKREWHSDREWERGRERNRQVESWRGQIVIQYLKLLNRLQSFVYAQTTHFKTYFIS
jgi:hypothetical protein